MSTDEENNVFCPERYLGQSSLWTIERVEFDKVFVRSKQERFLSAQLFGRVIVKRATKVAGVEVKSAASWESWELVRLGEYFAFRSFHGRFLSVDKSTMMVNAQAEEPHSSGLFSIIQVPPVITLVSWLSQKEEEEKELADLAKEVVKLRTCHQKYLVVDDFGRIQAKTIDANCKDLWEWELLTFEDQRVSLRTKRTRWYLCSEISGLVSMKQMNEIKYDAHVWTIDSKTEGIHSFQSIYGRYLCAQPSDAVVANRTEAIDWVFFHFERV